MEKSLRGWRLTWVDWLYTALTRAKELVLLAADCERMHAAVSRRTQRVTGLQLCSKTGTAHDRT